MTQKSREFIIDMLEKEMEKELTNYYNSLEED